MVVGQPEMRDPVGHRILCTQRGDQLIIARPALFRGQGETVVIQPGKDIPGPDAVDPVTRIAQALLDRSGKTGIIRKDQPGLFDGAQITGHVDVHVGEPRTPGRNRPPVLDRVQPRQRGRRRGHRRLPRFYEVARPLEAVGRQADAVAPRLAPDLAPVRLDAAGPEPPDHRDEVEIVRDLLVGMAQGRDDLMRGHVLVHLRQGGQGLAGTHFEIDARAAGAQRADALCKAYRVAQLADPVVGVCRLRRRQRLAGPVRDHFPPGRLQIEPGKKRAVAVEDRRQHPAVGGDVDGDALVLQPGRAKTVLQRIKCRLRTRYGDEFAGIDRGDVEIVAQKRLDRRERCRYRQHSALGHFVEKPSAQQHEVDQVFERHHPGKTGGDVFAHRMAHHRGGLHAPGHPQLRQRIFRDRDQRQLDGRFLQPLVGRSNVVLLGQPDRTDVVVQLRCQVIEPPVHPLGELRFGLVKIAGHPGVLRAATGKHEDDLGRIPQYLVGEDAAAVTGLQKGGSLFMGFRHHDAPPLKGAAAVLEREGDIGQGLFGMRAQMGRKGGGIGVQRSFRGTRNRQAVKRPVAFLGGDRGRGFF